MTTADKIIDTATELLQQRGFNAFSYSDISKLIGIKTASIHYHYPSKNELGKTVMSKYRERHQAAMYKIDSEFDSPLKKIQAFTQLFKCTFGRDYKMCPCAMLTTDIATLPDSIQDEVQGFYTDNESWLAAVLDDGRQQKIFTFDASPAECAKTLFAAFEGAMLSARAFEDNNRLSRSLKLIIKFIQA